jgi:hypothetical protein
LQIDAARAKAKRDKSIVDDDIERLSRVFNDEAKPTFVWQLDFAEIFHRSSRREEAHTSLLPDETRKEKETPAGCYGFDLVLANPPYIRQERFKDLKPLLENAYDCYTGTADLYVYFYERALKLLGHGGVFSFISSNKFFRAGYGEKLRKHLAENCHIRSIIDFGELPVFSAGTDPAIIIATKSEPCADDMVQTAMIKDAAEIDQLTHAVTSRRSLRLQSTLQVKGWTLENSAVLALLAKLRRVGKPLHECANGRLYRGILTALNEAFVIDRATRDQLIAENKSSAELLKPFLNGRDAQKWQADKQDIYLIKIESSLNKKHPWAEMDLADAERSFKKNYPAVHRWLMQFRDKLIEREDQGKFFWELRSCDYWQEIQQPKIIYNETSKELHAFFDEKGLCPNKTLFMLVAPQPKPLLAVLLSRTLDWLYRHEFPSWGDPWQGGRVQFRGDRMATIPIPDFSAADAKVLSGLVDGILAAQRTGDAATVTALESEIDTHVFRLYALTPAEIDLVKGTAQK